MCINILDRDVINVTFETIISSTDGTVKLQVVYDYNLMASISVSQGDLDHSGRVLARTI